MIPEGWKTYRLNGLIEIKPKINLKRSENNPFVEMKDLNYKQT